RPAVDRGNQRRTGIKPPKTKRGRRNITLPPETLPRSKRWNSGLLLGWATSRPRHGYSARSKETFCRRTISAGIGAESVEPRSSLVRFHYLRHTHALILIGKGVDILTISRRLGHAKPSVTLDTYGKLIKGADAAAQMP